MSISIFSCAKWISNLDIHNMLCYKAYLLRGSKILNINISPTESGSHKTSKLTLVHIIWRSQEKCEVKWFNSSLPSKFVILEQAEEVS